jgi:hypothetical protein
MYKLESYGSLDGFVGNTMAYLRREQYEQRSDLLAALAQDICQHLLKQIVVVLQLGLEGFVKTQEILLNRTPYFV